MNFFQLWFKGIISPSQAFEELKKRPAPFWGFWAVLTRFVGTSFTTILALYLLGRVPFAPSNLTFLTVENYYTAEIFFLPFFGLMIWFLMSAIVHLVLRLAGNVSDFDQVLNIVGMGMLIPMPLVWLWDWMMIALNLYQMTMMAVSHGFFQLWETTIESIGFMRILGIGASNAIGLALVINGVYVLLAIIFIR